MVLLTFGGQDATVGIVRKGGVVRFDDDYELVYGIFWSVEGKFIVFYEFFDEREEINACKDTRCW